MFSVLPFVTMLPLEGLTVASYSISLSEGDKELPVFTIVPKLPLIFEDGVMLKAAVIKRVEHLILFKNYMQMQTSGQGEGG